MIPVDSTRSAATHETSGSYSRASAGVIRFAGTPLATARSASMSSAGISSCTGRDDELAAHLDGHVVLAGRTSTMDRLPATDMRALNDPGL